MISIVVPVYNVEKELSRCIESIINQTYRDIEIIIVNDGSTDGSLRVCLEYKKIDSRIVVINKKNGGLSDARNAGMEEASGDYLMFIDSDDYIEIDACEKLLSCFGSEEVDFVVGAIKEIHSSFVVYQNRSNIMELKPYDAKEFIIRSIEAGEWYAPAVLNMYRRKFLIDNNLRFKKGRFYEDIEFMPRAYLAANQICYLNYPFYNYIIRDGSITTSKITEKKTLDAMTNYIEWEHLFNTVDDAELRVSLIGFMFRCYLNSCRIHHYKKWIFSNYKKSDLFRFSLSIKDKLIAILYVLFPYVFVRIK